MLFVMPFLLAMVVTMAWLPVFGRFATKWRIVDQPGERKVHSMPIPRDRRRGHGHRRPGGGASSSSRSKQSDRYFLMAAGVSTVFGALDDRFDLDYRIKLAWASCSPPRIVVFGGDIQIHALTSRRSGAAAGMDCRFP